MAARSGLEPESTAPKAVVLPLHYRATSLFVVSVGRLAARRDFFPISLNDARLKVLTEVFRDGMRDITVVKFNIRPILLQILFLHQRKRSAAFVTEAALDLVFEAAL